MNSHDTAHDGKLESLEKWRNSELDRAQVLHTKTRTAAQRQEEAVASVQQSIEQSNELAREAAAGNKIISADALTRVRLYTTVQGDELKRAQGLLEDAQREVATAHAALLKRLEDLSVVERLRKRRTAQSQKEILRKEQRRLDDQALLRLGQTTRFNHETEG